MKISVCIATYNGERFIKEQLLSILSQLDDKDEIVISDDSSTDMTVDIIKSLNDKRIKLILNGEFHSPIYNFENAIKHATGDYIFLSDQDDVWRENKIKIMLPFLEEYDLVQSNAVVVDASLKVLKNDFFSPMMKKGLVSHWFRNPYTGCMMAFHRRALKYILPFPNKLPMHDIWIGLCCDLFAKVYFLDEKMILYRRHGNNVSAASEKSNLPLIYRVQYRFRVAIYLIKRFIKVKL